MKSILPILIVYLLTVVAIGDLQSQTKQSNSKAENATKKLLEKSSFEDNPTFVSTELSLLRNPFVLEELDLVDYQREDLKNIQYQWRKDMNSIVRSNPSQRGRERTQKILTLYKVVSKKIDAVLLKGQIARLRQITLQSLAVKNAKGPTLSASVLRNSLVMKELKITRVQKVTIRDRAEEINRKLLQDISKLKMEANDELLEVLNVKQRKSYQQLVGSPFEFRRNSRTGDRH